MSKELVIITASMTNDCQFGTNSHCDLVDIADIVKDPLIVIEDIDWLAPRERVAVAYTRAAIPKWTTAFNRPSWTLPTRRSGAAS